MFKTQISSNIFWEREANVIFKYSDQRLILHWSTIDTVWFNYAGCPKINRLYWNLYKVHDNSFLELFCRKIICKVRNRIILLLALIPDIAKRWGCVIANCNVDQNNLAFSKHKPTFKSYQLKIIKLKTAWTFIHFILQFERSNNLRSCSAFCKWYLDLTSREPSLVMTDFYYSYMCCRVEAP